MRIDFHKRFDKQFSRLSTRLKGHFKERLDIFAQDPHNPVLGNHALKGKYQGYRSIDIAGDLRAIYFEHSREHVEFAYIGTHAQLYE